MSQELAFLPATRQAELIRAREISPVELTELYLTRIEKLDGELNAFVTVTAEEALADAARKEKQVAAGEDLPPFHGVPIPIKDLDDVAGVRTTYSSRSFESHVPGLGRRHGCTNKGGRVRAPRKVKHPGVRDDPDDRVGPQWRMS